MGKIKYLKSLGICLFIITLIYTQTACTNNKLATDSTSIIRDNVTTSNGQTVNEADSNNDNNDIMIMEKKALLVSLNEKSVEFENKRTELESQIKAYLGNNINMVGLSYYDINSGKEIIINGDKTFLAASTVKVQMNMVLDDMIQNGTVSENESLQYTDDSFEEGTGILQSQDLSKPISLSLLSDYSIIYSDNIATNMIIKRINYYNMRNMIDAKLGHATDKSGNFITATDETTLLKQLYENVNNNTYYSKIIDDMKNTEFHDRLDLYLPYNIVAHKVGNYDSYVNDVGIIYTENPYILSIYTNGLDNANEVIAHISKMIYDFQVNYN
ncbi:serine hydrolase [Candidatus Clostridium radicumherbarum]|uniref:Serine hydrolase n=1 Tax=Candidatus Clostridium radicumherbarum TaxID=3381662 RepID=A0ABW8TM00_9CLOT